MFNNPLKGILVHAILPIIVLLLASAANASHFRFGHFTWEARPDISPTTVDFRMTVAFRSSYFGHPNIGQTFRPGGFVFGDGRSASFTFEVIARNLQEDWIVGRAIQTGLEGGIVRHEYPAVNNNGNPWQAGFSGCCKIGSLRNAANANWRVVTLVNLEDGNASPFSNLPPIVTCSKFDCRFRIPAVDPNGDRIVWRMATRSESSIPSVPAGMEVNSENGIFTWEGAETFTNGLYSVQVIIEDRDADDTFKSNTAIDFIINLQDQGANAWPEFDIPPTPESGSVIQAIVGQPLLITVQATDPDPNDEVFLNHVGLPVGATFEQTVSGEVTGVATLEWIPTTEDMGQHIVTFLANDNRGGASTPVAVTIDVLKPAISDVRVVSTISTTDIQIDTNSYSLPPTSVAVDDASTVVTWEFPTFNVGQIEDLNTQLHLFNLNPGETQIVTEKLELYYTDIDGAPVYELLDEQRVKVAPTLTTVSIATDKPLYLPGEQVSISTLLENLSDVPANALVEVEIVDNQNNLVSSLGTFTENQISPLAQVSLPVQLFDTTNVYAGAYEAVAKLVEDETVVQQASAPFAITTENGEFVSIGALVNTDKPLYQAWDQAIVAMRVLNATQNAAFNGGDGQLRVIRPNGEILAQQNYAVNSLAPQAISDRQFVLPLVDREAGVYQVEWVIVQDGVTLASSTTTFEVNRQVLMSLLGSVDVNNYPTGEAQSCSFETINRSLSSDITTTLVYQLVNLDTSELVYEVREVDIDIHNATPYAYQLLLGDPPAYGGYACILMAEIDGELSQLAAAGFEATPPKINLEIIPGTRGKLLVLIDDNNFNAPHDVNQPENQRAYLESVLTENGWNYTLVDTEDTFATEFYSGVYSAIAILSESVQLSPLNEDLLVEAQNNGVGLLVGGSWNRRNSAIERGLGIKLTGQNSAATSIIVSNSVLEEPIPTDAAISSGLVLAHCNASVLATFNLGNISNDQCAYQSAPAAVTQASYGKGKNTYFAYDVLDAATSDQGVHEQLLLLGLEKVQPEIWPSHAGRVIPVAVSVENLSRKAAVDVRISLPQGGDILESTLSLQKVDSTWLWQRDYASSSIATIILYVVVPEGVSGDVLISVDVDAGINRSLIVDNQVGESTLATLPSESQYQRTLDLVNIMKLNGIEDVRADYVENRIQSAESSIEKNKIENAMHSLLQATTELAPSINDSSIAARLVIDEWLFLLQKSLNSEGQ